MNNLENVDQTRIPVAFLGGGYESAVGRVHRVAVEMDKRFELVAGCFSLNAENNRQSAIQYGVSPDRNYENLEQLLVKEAGKIGAVIILTPTDQHKAQVITALEAGVPVVCEKALATSCDEAVEIGAVIKRQRGFLAVTYNYTGYPMLRELKSMVENDKFGRIQQIHIEMPQEGFLRLNKDGEPVMPQDWRLRDNVIPTISLDLGVHLHNIVRFLTGAQPLEVVAMCETYGNFTQVIDNISCLARFENNLNCSVWYSKTALGYRNGLKIRLFGENGSAEWIQEYPEYLNMADRQGRKFMIDRAGHDMNICNQSRYTRFKAGHPAGFIEAFANYYYDIADALKEYSQNGNFHQNQYVYGIDESREGLNLLESINRSSAEQRWVQVK